MQRRFHLSLFQHENGRGLINMIFYGGRFPNQPREWFRQVLPIKQPYSHPQGSPHAQRCNQKVEVCPWAWQLQARYTVQRWAGRVGPDPAGGAQQLQVGQGLVRCGRHGLAGLRPPRHCSRQWLHSCYWRGTEECHFCHAPNGSQRQVWVIRSVHPSTKQSADDRISIVISIEYSLWVD